MNQEDTSNLKKITLRKLREKVREVKTRLPKDNRITITF